MCAPAAAGIVADVTASVAAICAARKLECVVQRKVRRPAAALRAACV
jgi:hypothetical protein